MVNNNKTNVVIKCNNNKYPTRVRREHDDSLKVFMCSNSFSSYNKPVKQTLF